MKAKATKNMKLDDWWPPLGIRATWLEPRFTARESTLLGALDALVRHDNAADVRADQPNCSELQHAMEVLNAFAGDKELWTPRQ